MKKGVEEVEGSLGILPCRVYGRCDELRRLGRDMGSFVVKGECIRCRKKVEALAEGSFVGIRHHRKEVGKGGIEGEGSCRNPLHHGRDGGGCCGGGGRRGPFLDDMIMVMMRIHKWELKK